MYSSNPETTLDLMEEVTVSSQGCIIRLKLTLKNVPPKSKLAVGAMLNYKLSNESSSVVNLGIYTFYAENSTNEKSDLFYPLSFIVPNSGIEIKKELLMPSVITHYLTPVITDIGRETQISQSTPIQKKFL